MEFLPIQSFTTECVFCRRISDRQRKGMKSRHERAALFGFFRNCSETLISSDVNREGYAYRAIESAKIDGAGHMTILFRIVLPLSTATIAVVILYYAVAYWNAWFGAMIYLRDRAKYPLQLVMREILIQNDTSSMTTEVGDSSRASVSESIKYAVVIIGTLPILMVYPMIQKHFVKGVMLGAVKG